jgi:hypothetical protein
VNEAPRSGRSWTSLVPGVMGPGARDRRRWSDDRRGEKIA